MNEFIIQVLFKFANSFDLKDWRGLEDTLMDHIECDYKELRNTSENYSKGEYVRLRQEALDHLKTQHIFSNLQVTIKEKQATCQLSAVIFRQDNLGVSFNSHAIYFFNLVNIKDNEWRIKKIKQSVLWSEGDSSIHAGISGKK